MSQTKKAEQGAIQQDVTSQEQVLQLPINMLVEFTGHPFNVLDDDAMNELVQNISKHGVVSPIIVRKMANGMYEIISGHRRVHASKRAGLETVPVIVKELDDDQAAILMVDTNLQQREKITASERGRAYRLKMEKLAHQGRRSDLKTSDQVDTKSTAELIAEEWGTSIAMVRRYIRLTYLIPGIQVYVDKDEMGLVTGVELSYLSEIEQNELVAAIVQTNKLPSSKQAKRIRELSGSEDATHDTMAAIIMETKHPQIAPVTFDYSELSLYFPEEKSPTKIKKIILGLLADYNARGSHLDK